MMYSIGQVAELFGLPVSTLRYYDREGLFPNMERRSGARRFSDRELETLRVIECLKRSGMEIRDIRQFMLWCSMGASTYSRRREMFEKRLAAVDAEIAELERTRSMLRYKCWYYATAMEDGSEDRIQELLPDNLPEEIQTLFDHAHSKD